MAGPRPARCLLPLRPTAMVAEEVAWLAALHPGRVGLGVAAGALPFDFEVMGLSAARAVPVFKSELPRVVDMLRGRELRQRWAATRPCNGAPSTRCRVERGGVGGGCRPGRPRGAGLLMEGMSPGPASVQGHGGLRPGRRDGTKVLIRRVWLGDVRADLVEPSGRSTTATPGAAGFGNDQTVASADPDRMADLLHEVMRVGRRRRPQPAGASARHDARSRSGARSPGSGPRSFPCCANARPRGV